MQISNGKKAKGKGEIRSNRFHILIVVLTLLFAAACAEVRLHTINAPPPSAKLRVFIQAFSGHRAYGHWIIPHEEFAKIQLRVMQKSLQKKGIYEVVREEEIKAVLGRQWVSQGDWERKDWDLVKKVGKTLHAEYGMIIGRSIVSNTYLREMVLINIETGKQFKVFSRLELRGGEDVYLTEFSSAAYREFFNIASSDMLALAIRKGRHSAGVTIPSIAPTSVSEKPSVSSPLIREMDSKKLLHPETKAEGRTQLVIYDFDAFEPYKIPALILSEALREEIFRLGYFTMVNRENIVTVLEEMALQQTGLVDEKQAIQVGKALAANQIVVGKLSLLGKTLVLQTKRIDLQTMATLAIASINCGLGKEEELLERMPELVQKLVGQ